ncbi:hypothetical protein HDE_00502 [Halotydeus destructor]|nr:hypothetical protein HDE_00502 [Halotydeus destructor]
MIINLKLNVFEKVFRLYAMISSNFVDLTLVRDDIRAIMEERGTVQYDEAINYFDETLNMSMKDVGSLRFTSSLFSMYKQLFAEFKTSMKTNRLDPVNLLESKLLPLYCVISDNKSVEKVEVPSDMILATDFFHFFQETLCQARMTVSRYAATIDLVLSMIPLVVIMQHEEQQAQKPSEIVYGRILSSSASLSEMTEAECSLTSDKIQQLVFSFMGFQLYRLTTGFYDSAFIKTNIFQTVLASVRRYCSLRHNKTHDSKYRFLVRNLTDTGTDPDEKIVGSISQLYGAVKHEIVSVIQRHQVDSNEMISLLTSQMFPFALFVPVSESVDHVRTFYAYLPIHMCHRQVQESNGGLRKLCRLRKRILSLFERTNGLLKGRKDFQVNPLTSAVFLEDEQLAEDLSNLLDEWVMIFKDE